MVHIFSYWYVHTDTWSCNLFSKNVLFVFYTEVKMRVGTILCHTFIIFKMRLDSKFQKPVCFSWMRTLIYIHHSKGMHFIQPTFCQQYFWSLSLIECLWVNIHERRRQGSMVSYSAQVTVEIVLYVVFFTVKCSLSRDFHAGYVEKHTIWKFRVMFNSRVVQYICFVRCRKFLRWINVFVSNGWSFCRNVVVFLPYFYAH